MSGFAQVVGEPDGPPTLPPFMLADGVAAQAAAWSTMMALYHRDLHGGGGQLIDLNLVEPLARLIETSPLAFDQLGTIPGRVGNQLPASAPRNAYPTADGHAHRHLQRLAQHRRAGVPPGRSGRLADRSRLRRPVRRRAHAEEVDATCGGMGRRAHPRRGHEGASSRPRSPPLPSTTPSSCSPTSTSSPAAPSCGSTTPISGSVRVQAPVAWMSETPGGVDHLGRDLGADNDAVYGGLLGLDAERLAALRADVGHLNAGGRVRPPPHPRRLHCTNPEPVARSWPPRRAARRCVPRRRAPVPTSSSSTSRTRALRW